MKSFDEFEREILEQKERKLNEYIVALESIQNITRQALARTSSDLKTKLTKVKNVDQLKLNAQMAVKSDRGNTKISAMESYCRYANLDDDEIKELKLLLEQSGF